MGKMYLGPDLVGTTESKDINFNNSGTSVTSSNVQDALKEVANKTLNEVELTKAEYENMKSAGTLKSNVNYYVTDDDSVYDASDVAFNNTASTLKSTTVESAIKELANGIQSVTEEEYLALEAAGNVDPNVVYFVDDGK